MKKFINCMTHALDIENEDIPTNDDPFIRDEIPFIFEFDKAST